MRKKGSLFLTIALCLSANIVLAADEVLVKGELTQVSKEQFLSALERMDERTRKQFLSKENRVLKPLKITI